MLGKGSWISHLSLSKASSDLSLSSPLGIGHTLYGIVCWKMSSDVETWLLLKTPKELALKALCPLTSNQLSPSKEEKKLAPTGKGPVHWKNCKQGPEGSASLTDPAFILRRDSPESLWSSTCLSFPSSVSPFAFVPCGILYALTDILILIITFPLLWMSWHSLQRLTDQQYLQILQETFRFHPWIRTIPWRREWLPSPVFLPGEFDGQKSLVGYSPWGRRAGRDWVINISLHFSKS